MSGPAPDPNVAAPRDDGRLVGRLIGLGVTGSIAAYKAVELLRLLRAEGADVVAMLTPAATRFVGPLSFAALSRHPVETDVLDLLPDGRIGHIVIADSVDAIVVAPATAHWIGAMAHGLAGDAVAAACLATSAPVVVAPAMDGEMWTHPATVDNTQRLRERFGYAVVDPEAGPLASGQSGQGRLADLAAIVEAVVAAVGNGPVRTGDPAMRPPVVEGGHREPDLEGRHVVVTAGGTREAIDPVRFIGNRSTGRMGVAVAAAAADRGARVTLVAANLEIAPPSGIPVVRVESTADLAAALHGLTRGTDGQAGFDALVMAAAVADFRPAVATGAKLERSATVMLALEPTPDVLAGIADELRDGTPTGRRPILVGFAAETGPGSAGEAAGAGEAGVAAGEGGAVDDAWLDRAAAKLSRKGVDLLVANDVMAPDSGFGTDTNRVTILAPDGSREALPLLAKREVADRILDRVAAALDARDAAGSATPAAPGAGVETGASLDARHPNAQTLPR